MKKENTKSAATAIALRNGERAQTRIVILLAIGFLLGLGAGAYWFRRPLNAEATAASRMAGDGDTTTTLSEATRSLLQRLPGPVEIHFHSVLNETQGAAPWLAFARRVDELLAQYARGGDGKIVVTRSESRSAAMADGIEPLRLDKGELCFFGIAVSGAGQRTAIPRLAAEWEGALEFDLSRAIAQVASGQPAGAGGASPAPVAAATTAELLRATPDIESLPLAEGTLKLRALSLEEFKTAVSAMQNELNEAQQRLAEAQSENAQAAEAARKKLQQLQTAQSEKISEISRRMQARISALEQLKRENP